MKLHLRAVLNAQELSQARQLLDSADWIDGHVTSGSQTAQMKSNLQLPEQSASSLQLQQIVLSALRRNQMFFSAALPARISPPLFSCYRDGNDFLRDHGDVALRFSPDGSVVRTDLSCTLFLNEPDEYDGGELVIADAWRDEAIKLAAGDLLLYPAGHIHRIEPVRRGCRLASFLWIESRVRSTEQRRLLFDMDCHLMRLRSQLPERDPALVGLASTYHNLLRMWAGS